MALKTVTEYFGVGRDEIDQGEEIITVKVGGDNFLEKTQDVKIIYNFNSEVPVTFKIKNFLPYTLYFTTYYSNGEEYNTYKTPSTSTTMTAYAGGMVLLDTNGSRKTLGFYDVNGTYHGLGAGSKIRFTIPSSVTGTGVLDVNSGSQGVYVYLNNSTGWCRAIPTFSGGSS